MTESLWLIAFACHGIGCRAWLAAWPTEHHHVLEAWNELDVSEADKWNFENSQRIAKVSRTLADRDMLLEIFLHSITDQPLDALIQFASASGTPMTSTRPRLRPIIFDMINSSGSPVENAQRSHWNASPNPIEWFSNFFWASFRIKMSASNLYLIRSEAASRVKIFSPCSRYCSTSHLL